MRRGQTSDAPTSKTKNEEGKTETKQIGFDCVFKLDKVQITGFPDMGNWYYWKKGFRWELTAGETSLKDVKFDESLRLSGGGYYIPATSHEGDYIEFQIVDVDGLYYSAGTVISTFISTDYVWDGKDFDVQMADAVLVYAGLYLRLKYVSTGTENVVIYTWYHMRHISS